MKVPILRMLVILCGLSVSWTRAGVVINEIFYHAPNDLTNLQYLELYNSSGGPVDLSGWKLSKDMDYRFPAGTTIAADGYLVLARDTNVFKEHYGFVPAGTFKESLGRKGMRIDLEDRRGKKIDSIKYKDDAPWPLGADGYSASLERICPSVDGHLPENWAASPLPADEMKPSGTPGARNANFATVLPPTISNVKYTPSSPTPDQAITVEAEVGGPGTMRAVNLCYRLAGPGAEQEEVSISMSNASGRRFTGTIPGQADGKLIRFRIQAINEKGAQRFLPAEHEPRPAFSCYVHDPFEPAKIPFALVVDVDKTEQETIAKHLQMPNQRGVFSEEDQQRMFLRMRLETGIDLPALWFELAAHQPMSGEQLRQLAPIFTRQEADREKLLNDAGAAGDPKEKLKEVPQLVKSFHASLSTAVKPVLDETHTMALTEAQEKQVQRAEGGQMNWTPEMLLQRVCNLENTFYKVSTRPDVTETQLDQVRTIYRAALEQRSQFVEPVRAMMKGQGDSDDLRDKVEKMNQEVRQKVKAVLTPAQNRELAQVLEENPMMRGQGRTKPPHRPQGRSAFIYVDPQTRQPEVFDFVNVTTRNSGLNVHFQKDRTFHDMSTVNVLFESNDRFVLAEPLAYELYRRLGNAAPQAEYARLWVDGKPFGYFEIIEQPNRAFLERNHFTGDGNLYKILWYGRGVVGQHEKKTNRQTGHEDIVTLVDALETNKDNPAQEWAIIKKNFNVEQVVNYFAINMCLSHWDGFFNNYFTYHDSSGSGRWEMYPWDQDKTWGFYDGIPEGQVFYDMPLSFGMEGDLPPGWPKDKPAPRGFGMGWWRPGGWFSKPLLANPSFRKLFLARTKEILETVYTPEVFFPIIERQGEQLRDEVRLRAELTKEDPEKAVQRLQQNLLSLKEHLTKRRQFLLEQHDGANSWLEHK